MLLGRHRRHRAVVHEAVEEAGVASKGAIGERAPRSHHHHLRGRLVLGVGGRLDDERPQAFFEVLVNAESCGATGDKQWGDKQGR